MGAGRVRSRSPPGRKRRGLSPALPGASEAASPSADAKRRNRISAVTVSGSSDRSANSEGLSGFLALTAFFAHCHLSQRCVDANVVWLGSLGPGAAFALWPVLLTASCVRIFSSPHRGRILAGAVGAGLFLWAASTVTGVRLSISPMLSHFLTVITLAITCAALLGRRRLLPPSPAAAAASRIQRQNEELASAVSLLALAAWLHCSPRPEAPGQQAAKAAAAGEERERAAVALARARVEAAMAAAGGAARWDAAARCHSTACAVMAHYCFFCSPAWRRPHHAEAVFSRLSAAFPETLLNPAPHSTGAEAETAGPVSGFPLAPLEVLVNVVRRTNEVGWAPRVLLGPFVDAEGRFRTDTDVTHRENGNDSDNDNERKEKDSGDMRGLDLGVFVPRCAPGKGPLRVQIPPERARARAREALSAALEARAGAGADAGERAEDGEGLARCAGGVGRLSYASLRGALAAVPESSAEAFRAALVPAAATTVAKRRR